MPPLAAATSFEVWGVNTGHRRLTCGFDCGSGGAAGSISPVDGVGLSALPAGLSGTAGAATLTLPSDSTVMIQDQTQQVFLVLQYHFGRA